MPYRNKVFVSFDGDADIHYYRLMCAWKQSDKTDFNFFNAHDITQARDSSTEETIKRSLSQRLANSRVFVCLVGESTRYLYKFVRWEMEQALNSGIPVICVNLNGKRSMDENRCPPIIRNELAVHVSFNAAIIQYSLEYWPDEHYRLIKEKVSGPRYYSDAVYKGLGL